MTNNPSNAMTNDELPSPQRQWGGHPQGLWVLFIVEMWERFSYYGMRALLVLYLIRSTAPLLADGTPNANPGFGWSADKAYALYAVYTWAVYVTPLFGGWLADRYLGTHRSMMLGGWIIALGHITLALTEFFGITPSKAVSLQTGPGALLCFVSGLILIVIGTGLFKPCASVMVGQLYSSSDPKKDSGFTIFYMGINLGAFLAPLVAGTLGERYGWHYGFGAAAVGMIVGLLFYQGLRPWYLRGVGLAPTGRNTADHAATEVIDTELARVYRQRFMVILVLAFVGNIFFWSAFEQAGTSMNVFALEKTDRTVGGRIDMRTGTAAATTEQAARTEGARSSVDAGFPASWYQSVNPLTILLFGPVFAWLWVWLDRRRLNPSTPMKFVWGLLLLSLAFIAMVGGAFDAQRNSLAGAHWLLITYVVVTWGELCLSPVGLSMVTKLAPPGRQSLMMGVWFLSMAGSNLLAGLIAVFSRRLESGDATFIFPGLPGFFLMLVLLPLTAAMVLWLATPALKRMMHGVH